MDGALIVDADAFGNAAGMARTAEGAGALGTVIGMARAAGRPGATAALAGAAAGAATLALFALAGTFTAAVLAGDALVLSGRPLLAAAPLGAAGGVALDFAVTGFLIADAFACTVFALTLAARPGAFVDTRVDSPLRAAMLAGFFFFWAMLALTVHPSESLLKHHSGQY